MPKLKNISFFEKLEFVEEVDKKRRIAVFRQPVVNLLFDSLPSKGTIAMSIIIDEIELNKEYLLDIVLKDPQGDTLSKSGGPIKLTVNDTPMFPPSFSIIYQPDELTFAQAGIYTVTVLLDNETLGQQKFGVCGKG